MKRKYSEKFTIEPVGYVKSPLKEPILRAGRDDIALSGNSEAMIESVQELRAIVSELVIDNLPEGILYGIEEFSHILVLYWPHLVPPEGRKLTRVHPMGREELPLVGVFSTCSPARPNPILVTAVRLLERRGNTLLVQGLDAVDGSPIIDIKPYVPSFLSVDHAVVSDWMERIEREFSGRERRGKS